MIEEELRRISLVAPADSVRDRILAAMRVERADRLVGRWIARAAAAAVGLSMLAAVWVDGNHPAPAARSGLPHPSWPESLVNAPARIPSPPDADAYPKPPMPEAGRWRP